MAERRGDPDWKWLLPLLVGVAQLVVELIK